MRGRPRACPRHRCAQSPCPEARTLADGYYAAWRALHSSVSSAIGRSIRVGMPLCMLTKPTRAHGAWLFGIICIPPTISEGLPFGPVHGTHILIRRHVGFLDNDEIGVDVDRLDPALKWRRLDSLKGCAVHVVESIDRTQQNGNPLGVSEGARFTVLHNPERLSSAGATVYMAYNPDRPTSSPTTQANRIPPQGATSCRMGI